MLGLNFGEFVIRISHVLASAEPRSELRVIFRRKNVSSVDNMMRCNFRFYFFITVIKSIYGAYDLSVYRINNSNMGFGSFLMCDD